MSETSGWQLSSDAPTAYTRFALKIMEPQTDDLIFAAECRDGDHVLDVGCGTGLVANRINLVSRKFCTITGIDAGWSDRLEWYTGPAAVGKRVVRCSKRIRMLNALATDPGSIDAQAWLANLLTGRVLDGFSPSPAEDIKRAEALLGPALAAAPRRPFLHYIKAQILRAVAQGGWGAFNLNVEARTARFAEAIPEYELVIAANPNDAGALSQLAWCIFMTGSPADAVPLLDKSIRISRRDPFLYLRQSRLGTVYLFQGQIDAAIEQLENARRANSPFLPTHSVLTAAYGLKGDAARAATELAETREGLKRRGMDQYQTLTMIRQNSDWNTPPLHEAFEKYFIAGLRLAGWPDQ